MRAKHSVYNHKFAKWAKRLRLDSIMLMYKRCIKCTLIIDRYGQDQEFQKL